MTVPSHNMRLPTPAHPRAVVAVMLLLLVTGPSLVMAATEATFHITGSSFLWSLVLNDPSTALIVTSAVQADINAATSTLYPSTTFTVSSPDVDSRAMNISVSADADISEDMYNTIFNAPLTTLNSRKADLGNAASVSGYESLLPAVLAFYNPLPLASASDDSSGEGIASLPTIASYTTRQITFLTGTYEAWKNIMDRPTMAASVSALMAHIISAQLSISLITTTTKIDAIEPTEAGDLKSISSGYSGAKVSLTVTQQVHQLSRSPYGGDEIASLIQIADFSAVNLGNGTSPTVVACSVVGDFGLKLTAAGKGMIAMAAVAGAIMLGAFIVTLILVCCCCPRWMRPAEDRTGHEPSCYNSVGDMRDKVDADTSEPFATTETRGQSEVVV